MKSRRKNNLILVILLLIISVGFALLSSNLNIIGNSSIKRTVWNIYWDNVQKTEGSISGDNELIPAHIIGENNDTVEYSVILDTPGDFYEFTVDAVNESTLDAMIDDISLDFYEEDGETSKELPSYLTYTIKYADDTEVHEEDLLDAGETKTYKVRLEFIYDVDPEDLPTEGDVISLKFKVDYVQATNTKVNYTVTHKYEKLDSGYDTETETLKGPAGAQVTPEVKGRTGFISPQPQTVTIQADGSTNVIYTYTREEYTFAITDRTYIDPTSTPDGTYKYGTEITLKAQERPGYEFHWSDGDTNYNRTLTLEDNLSLTPIYEINEYVITLNPNGGSVSPTTISVTPGEAIGTIPTPTNGTQLFGGWYTATTGGEEVTKDTIPTGDMEIFARWFASNIVAVVNDTTGYTSLSGAINAAPTDGTLTKIKMLQNRTEANTVAAGKNILLDLNGKTVNHASSKVITNNGTLEIINGNLDANGSNVLSNAGTMNIKNCTITSNAGSGAVDNNANAVMMIEDTTITATGSRQGVYNKGGNLTIKDCNISATATQRPAVQNLNDGSTAGRTTILGNTTITSTGYAGLYIEGGTVVIGTKDGTIENSPVIEGKTYGVMAYGTYEFYDGILKGKTGSVGIAAAQGNLPTVTDDTNHTKITAIEDDSDYVVGTEGQYKTLTLDYLTPKYTIELNANGGEVTPTQIKIDQGSTIGEIPTPTYDEWHTFDGWYTQVSGGIEVDSTYIPTGNMEIFAHWTELPSYLIEFDENGGSSVEDIRIPQGSAITSLPTSTKEGYYLDGWYTSLPGGTKIEVGYIPTGNMNLIAHWGKSVSSMIIDPDEITITSYQGTETINIVNAEEIQEPYTFTSEDTSIATVDSNGVVTAVAEGRTTITITGTVSGETKEVTIIVKYNRYSIEFEENGGSEVEDKVVFEGQAIGTLPTTYLDHYFLEGWYTELQGGTKINENYIPQDDMVVYAHYTRAPDYTITFDANGGTVDEQSRVVSGDMAVGELPTPTRTNYYFMGWKDENSNKFYTSNTLPTKNVTLTAQWDTVEKVARINSTYYPSIQSAFDAAQTDDEVVLLVDRTESPTNNKKITFNLDKHTVTGYLTNNTSGDLTLLNGNIEYELSSSNVKTIDNSGTLTIGNENKKLEDGVNITATSTATSGDPNTYGIYGSTGEVTMNGGSINVTSIGHNAIGIYGKNIIMNDGKIIINGDLSEGVYGKENSTITINGGNIQTTGNGYGIAGEKNSTITINGGIITVTGTKSFCYGIYSEENNNITVNGGIITVTGTNSFCYGIYSEENSIIIINEGSIISSGEKTYCYGIYEGTSTTINGGSIVLNGGYDTYGIDSKNIIMNDGIINVTSSQEAVGIQGKDGVITINGGILDIVGEQASGIYGFNNITTINNIDINVNATRNRANNSTATGVSEYEGSLTINDGTINVTSKESNISSFHTCEGIVLTRSQTIINNVNIFVETTGTSSFDTAGINAYRDEDLTINGGNIFVKSENNASGITGVDSSDIVTINLVKISVNSEKEWAFGVYGSVLYAANDTTLIINNGNIVSKAAGYSYGIYGVPNVYYNDGIIYSKGSTNADSYGIYSPKKLILPSGKEIYQETSPDNYEVYYLVPTSTGNKTITFNANGGSVFPTSMTKKNGEAIGTMPTPTRTNYDFTGWYTAASGGDEVTSSTIINSDIPVYAHWTEIPEFTVTFDKNNSNATGVMPNQSIRRDVTAPLNQNTYIADGYQFIGWNTKRDGSGASYLDEGDITLNKNITLYAQWVKTYTLTFDKNNNDATGNTYTQELVSGVPTQIPDEAFNSYSLIGNIIDYYNTESNNTGDSYYRSQSITITSDKTLYAHWIGSVSSMIINPSEITITEPNGTDTINIVNAQEVQEPYTFTSNDTSIATVDSNGLVTAVAEGQTTITITGTLSGDIKEVPVAVQYTRYDVTFNSNGGRDVNSKIVIKSTPIEELPEAYLDHYYFDGWYTELQSGIKIEDNYIPQNDMTLYAHYTRAPDYTITFDVNGGDPISEASRVVSGDMAVGDLPTPTKTNYYFVGWKDEISNEFYTSNTQPTKNVTLKAQWSEVEKVARINSTYYTSIQDAFDAAATDDEVVLLVDRTENPINIKKIIFNLDNHTLTGRLKNIENGDLILLNGSIKNSGIVIDNKNILTIGGINPKLNDGVNLENKNATDYSPYGIQGYENSIVTLNSGTITSIANTENKSAYGILGGANGAVTMNGGTITAIANDYGEGIIGKTNTTVTMNGGSITATAVKSDALGITGTTVTMNGGEITLTAADKDAYGIRGINKGTVTMNGGTITATASGKSSHVYGIGGDSNIMINAGKIKTKAYYDLYGISGNTIIMNGGSVDVIATGSIFDAIGIRGDIIIMNDGNITTTGGFSTGINGKTVTMNNGTIIVTARQGGHGFWVNYQGAITINDGSIIVTARDSAYGIMTSSHGTETMNSAVIMMNGGKIITTSTGSGTYIYPTYGIYGNPNCIIIMNDGSISATASGESADAYGIYGKNNNNITMNGGIITAISSAESRSTYGIYGSTDSKVIMTDGIIYSKGWSESNVHSIDSPTKIYPTDKTLFNETSPDNYEVYYLVPTSSTGTKTITFNANGGSVFPTSMTKNDGYIIGTMPTPIRENYEFDGWYTSSSGGDIVTSSTVISSDLPVYAHWTEIPEFNITFDKNNSNATGIMSNQSIRRDVTAPLNQNEYELDGYQFIGWNTEPDGTGISYFDEENINLTKDITLYAQWAKIYTLTFDKNNMDAVGDTYSITAVSGLSTPIPDEAFSSYSLTGKVIDSYNTESNNTGSNYYEEQSIIITQNTTLYAQWAEAGADFATDSWDDIIASYQAGNITKLRANMKAGTTKDVNLGTALGVHKLRIANLSTPTECSQADFSQTGCGFVVEFADIISLRAINSGNTNIGGWPASTAITFLNTTVYNSIPSGLRNKIIDTKVVSGYGSNDSANFITTDKLYLLDAKEIYGESFITAYNTAMNYERQLDYYKFKKVTTSNYTGAIKQRNGSNYNWWLRSAYNNNYQNFYGIINTGDWHDSIAGASAGISPAFRIG